MNRNVESHFSQIPDIDIQRSIFDRSSTHKTSFNCGSVIPIYCDQILPGDSVRMTTSKVVRSQTMLTPIMDNMYLDTYWFFVPNRLVWKHWKEFCGENTQSAWVPETVYQIPTISAPAGGFATGTLADYFGLPVGVEWTNESDIRPMALPFRAYALVMNEFFRSENITDPLLVPDGDENQTGSNGSNYITDVANGGLPFIAARYHDMASSCLPSPQKAAEPVTFPLLSGDAAPVFTGESHPLRLGETAMEWNNPSGEPNTAHLILGQNGTGANADKSYARFASANTSNALGNFTQPINLWADLSTSVGAVSINELRLAFQLQRFYERNARSGTRYIEYIKAHFGVTSPDARLQRPEYLGGNRIQLNVHEVTNNAQSEHDFLGDLGAKSATSDIHEDFEHSFTEHGILLGLCVVRYDHSYSQGLEKFWTRRNLTEFYDPVFANIGEVPVMQSELCATAANMNQSVVFGYQEAWYDYRYKPDRVSGEMRPGVANSLASWHLADYYSAAPVLSDSWLREDKTNVDRVLAVTSQRANQFWADFYFDTKWTRPMPVYSVPGLIDHN